MQNIQIYPSYDDTQLPGYHEGYVAGYEAAWAEGYKRGWKDCDSTAFSRGVQNCYWFFYRLLNGGKQKSLSGEAQA